VTTGTRRKSRELAMQMLFQGDLGKQTPEQVGKTFWLAREESDAEVRGFAEDLYRVATLHAEEIDGLIVQHLVNWRLERMPGVDRNVLRHAVSDCDQRGARNCAPLLGSGVGELFEWRAGCDGEGTRQANLMPPWWRFRCGI